MKDDVYRQFSSFLNGLGPISPSDLQEVYDSLIVKNVKAKTVLVSNGQIADELYFIQKGLLRLYYTTDEGTDITGFIFFENMFAGSLESFLVQQPSQQTLETLEPTVLLVLSKKSLEELYQRIPVSHIIMRKVMEERFVSAQHILSSHILYNAEQRYLQFAHRYPNLLQRVPQHLIASFLGITPVSLSRIRNRISKQK